MTTGKTEGPFPRCYTKADVTKLNGYVSTIL